MSSVAVDDRRDGPEDRRELPREQPGRRTSDTPRKRECKGRCPHCQHAFSHVISDWSFRPYYDASLDAYVRYRRCDGCKEVFETAETVTRGC